ncbi:SWR1-complex protein 3 [Ranunculus cassubicifolius]
MEVNFPELPKDIMSDINKLKPFGPCILLKTKYPNENNIRKLYNLCTGEFHHLYSPETRGRRCIGSPSGWLFTIDHNNNTHLLNPFTRQQIPLPSLQTLREDNSQSSVFRFALSSSDPSSQHDCVVMIIDSVSRKLAFASPKSKSWTTIERADNEGYCDVIFFKDRFYALTIYGDVRVCDIGTLCVEMFDFPIFPRTVLSRFYLLEFSGDLLQLVFESTTASFLAFKLDFDFLVRMRINDLGDNAVFLGTNISFSVSTYEYPELKRNSIYFIHDYQDCYENGDMGIYDFRMNRIEEFYALDSIIYSFCPALFFTPSLV